MCGVLTMNQLNRHQVVVFDADGYIIIYTFLLNAPFGNRAFQILITA